MLKRIGSYLVPRDTNRVTVWEFPDGTKVDVRPVSRGNAPTVLSPTV